MKPSAIISVFLLLCSQSLFALGGKSPPSNDHSGTEQCAWYDEGKTEEHSPHQSQLDCRNHHGSCEMRCFVFSQVCTVDGTRTVMDIVNNVPVRREIRTSYRGEDQFSTYRAEEIALYQCQTAFPRNEICLRNSCHEEYRRTR